MAGSLLAVRSGSGFLVLFGLLVAGACCCVLACCVLACGAAAGWSETSGMGGRAEASIEGRSVGSGTAAGELATTGMTTGSADGLSGETMATVSEVGWLLEAALITATLATDPAMSTPPAATTVAMMLERCMGFSLIGAVRAVL